MSTDLQLDHDALRKALMKIEKATGIDPSLMHLHTIACSALDDNERSQLWQPTILSRLKSALESRQEKGLRSYGTTLDTANLPPHAVLTHLIDEQLDAAFYTLALADALYRHDFYLRLAEDAAVWLESYGYVQNPETRWWEHTENKSRVLMPAEAVRLYEVHRAGLGYSDQFERVSDQSGKNA